MREIKGGKGCRPEPHRSRCGVASAGISCTLLSLACQLHADYSGEADALR